MEWLYYLLEANLYLLLFYAFYFVALQNQTFYNNNRYYLLVSSLTAFLIPILQLGFLKPAVIVYQTDAIQEFQVEQTYNYELIVYSIYLVTALVFMSKFVINLFKIINIWLKSKKTNRGNITFIELEEQTTAFSFFNLLFIHPSLASKATVLKHEMVHIKQKHSVDILFFEILQVICWFNPIVYFIKKDIKLLHEYVADEESVGSEADKHAYAMFLIENSFGSSSTQLANQFFNQSILKRRINMLNKKKSGGWSQLRLALALPLAGIMLCTSTLAFSKDYGYFDLLPEKSNLVISPQQEVKPVKKAKSEKDIVKFPPPIVKPDGKNLKTPSSYKTKKDQVKFPPPIVKPDGKSSSPYKTKKDHVKFPPPIVKPDVKKTDENTIEGEPIKKAEMLEVTIKADQPKQPELLEVTIKGDPPKSTTKELELKKVPAKNNLKSQISAEINNKISKLKAKQTAQKKEATQIVSTYKNALEKKSSDDKLTKLYNASRYQTLFYPSKKTTPEEGVKNTY